MSYKECTYLQQPWRLPFRRRQGWLPNRRLPPCGENPFLSQEFFSTDNLRVIMDGLTLSYFQVFVFTLTLIFGWATTLICKWEAHTTGWVMHRMRDTLILLFNLNELWHWSGCESFVFFPCPLSVPWMLSTRTTSFFMQSAALLPQNQPAKQGWEKRSHI